MNKNGIEHKDVPEHRLINAKKIAVNSSVHDYRKAEKPQLPKQNDTMWTWIKKNALKRLLPFLKEVIDPTIELDYKDGKIFYKVIINVLGEKVWGKAGNKEL